MAHFAEIENNLVLRVIVAEQDFINSGAVGDSFNWIQTSYSGGFRKNYAAVGNTYDKTRDAFMTPIPYPSWVLVEATCLWTAPTAYPDDGNQYEWNEDTTTWTEIT